MKTKSTKDRILKYLLSGRKLTFLKAWERFNTLSIRERVRDLRREGYPIESEIVYKNKKRFAVYSLSLDKN